MRTQVLDRARADARVVAAAAVGSSASGGDRWSDLDLTLGVADGIPIQPVLADWTAFMKTELEASVLFDLPVGAIIYRVFLLPGALQVDLSFASASDFGARGPRFELLFGEAVAHPWPPAPSPEHIFGLAAHHAVRAHICIERGRLWQAEYWIHSLRDEALALACVRRGVEHRYGRGVDKLPPAVRESFSESLVRALDVSDLRRALAAAAAGLLGEAEGLSEDAARVRPMLREMLQP